MNSKLTFLLMLLAGVALVSTDQRPTYTYRGEESSEESSEEDDSYESSEASYNFKWAVKDESSENDFGHEEAREGDDTHGSYYVDLPDGRRLVVTYYVEGDSGFVPEVTFEGEAEYPESDESEEDSDESEEDSNESSRRGYYSR